MKAYHDQHFLIDPHAIQRIADLEEVKGKRVLEIGPGNGALTRALLDRGAVVHAIELDSILCEQLADTFSSEIAQGQLVVQQGDATRCVTPPVRYERFQSPLFCIVQDHVPAPRCRFFRCGPDVPERVRRADGRKCRDQGLRAPVHYGPDVRSGTALFPPAPPVLLSPASGSFHGCEDIPP